jgi:hypothetical protein
MRCVLLRGRWHSQINLTCRGNRGGNPRNLITGCQSSVLTEQQWRNLCRLLVSLQLKRGHVRRADAHKARMQMTGVCTIHTAPYIRKW